MAYRQLARRLPSGTAFVDNIRYVRFEWDPQEKGQSADRSTPTYAAFIVGPNRPARRVELGPDGAGERPAEAMEQGLSAWLAAIEGGPSGPQAQAFRRWIWDKLAPHVPPGTRTIYLSPDGALAGLPWVAIPVAADGTSLLERYALAVVPHGPFLLERLSVPQGKKARNDGLLLAVGEVDYDHEPAGSGTRNGSLVLARASRGPVDRCVWKELKRTGSELDRLLTLARPREVIEHLGVTASAQEVLRDLPRARWAVLATHACYADEKVGARLGLNHKAFVPATFGQRSSPGVRNPLVLSCPVLSCLVRSQLTSSPRRRGRHARQRHGHGRNHRRSTTRRTRLGGPLGLPDGRRAGGRGRGGLRVATCLPPGRFDECGGGALGSRRPGDHGAHGSLPPLALAREPVYSSGARFPG